MQKAKMRRRVAGSIALAVPLAIAGTAAPAAAQPTKGPVKVRLDPTKRSHAHGWAKLVPTSNDGLKVWIHTTGLVPNQPHAQHIHGDTSGKHFQCPPAKADKNSDGYVSIPEALPYYGNIFMSMTTKGDTSAKSGLALKRFPVANSDGVLNYRRTFSKSELPKGLLSHLTKLHLVQHGVDANHNNKYDLKGLGQSKFAKSQGVKGVPAEATDTATCGMVTPGGSINTGGSANASGVTAPAALGAGLAALAVAGGLVVMRRRFVRRGSNGRKL